MQHSPFDVNNIDKFLPVNEYIGGIEHAILHLLYARFFVKALKKIGMLQTSEPFERLITQGMICHKTFKNKLTNKFITPQEAKLLPSENVEIGDSIKMSKSKKNIVDPEDIVQTFGADTARLFVLSDSPPDKDIDWSDEGINGCNKFIKRLYNICISFKDTYKALLDSKFDINSIKSSNGFKIANKLLSEYLYAFDEVVLNKCVSKSRELFNLLQESNTNEEKFVIITYLLKMLNPIIPHVCEEIWLKIGHEISLSSQLLPSVDFALLNQDKITIAIQVNGKVRGTIEIDNNISQDEIEKQAINIESVKKQIENKTISKVIYIKNKVLNFIVQ